MNPLIEKLPLATTVLAAALSATLFRHWRRRRQPQLAWGALGTLFFGLGTLMESITALAGWSEPVFRLWYIFGALLGAAPLAQGTAYLLKPRAVADRYAVGLIVFATAASVLAWRSPIDPNIVNHELLSASILQWQWLRLLSPVLNLYALWFLVGGAAWSAWQYHQRQGSRARFLGNCLIAIGATLPGIGGAFARFHGNATLYVTELAGLALIAAGYAMMRREEGQSLQPTPA